MQFEASVFTGDDLTPEQKHQVNMLLFFLLICFAFKESVLEAFLPKQLLHLQKSLKRDRPRQPVMSYSP